MNQTRVSKVTKKQGPSNSTIRGRKPTDSRRETDGIIALRVGNRVLGQGRSIEKMKRIKKNNFHRTTLPRFVRPCQLRARTQAPLHCPPKQVA